MVCAVIGNLSYAYDALGQRTKMGGSWAQTSLPEPATAQYDLNNRLQQWNDQVLDYDDNGNLIADGKNKYEWNARDQLIAIRDYASGNLIAAFSYDGFGRRLGKTIDGVTTNFRYDGHNPIQIYEGNAISANMLSGLSLDEWYAKTQDHQTLSYLHDALGSTLALADAANITAQYRYDPYGKSKLISGSGGKNPFTYTGREDDGTGLYYYRARYYHPQFSRFISEDPIGLAGGINLYAYVAGNPIQFNDPLGLWRWGDPLPQGLVNFSVGFGDGVISAMSLGFASGSEIRAALGIDGGVDSCNALYQGAYVAGEVAAIGAMAGVSIDKVGVQNIGFHGAHHRFGKYWQKHFQINFRSKKPFRLPYGNKYKYKYGDRHQKNPKPGKEHLGTYD